MPPPEPEKVDKRQAAREVIDILHEIATLLNTHLNRQQLSYCVSLIENGVNPEALAEWHIRNVAKNKVLDLANFDVAAEER
ncbi:hypothetical protein H2199_003445 [Coniosporium tulheliwenetii]|uniref:Uncharacterized protein n=1 Tax=Coniosporium tulheliwenetii TaxID=3383036 RepID=A0ACC2Z9S8_9PEZI|nr:hypothetical protein H2199_003445 [Cladosporium sp. JES 115]